MGTELAPGEGHALARESQLARRKEDREGWDAFWKLRSLEAQGHQLRSFRFYLHRVLLDAPVTWFREKIVEPLHDKNKLAFYHRKISRVRDIDQCPVTDQVCILEANVQFRRDKMVDHAIMKILKERSNECMKANKRHWMACAQVIEDEEAAELNYFIKYGELGTNADVRDCYQKQKHRMVWERRNPEIMKERERLYQEHLRNLEKGKFDLGFYRKGYVFQDLENWPYPYKSHGGNEHSYNTQQISRDWEFYRDKDTPETKTYEDEQYRKRYSWNWWG